MRTGGMADVDLGVLVHDLIDNIKSRESQRNYPAWRAQIASEPCIMHRNRRCRRATRAGFLDVQKRRRDNSQDEKTPEEAPWREG